MKPFSNNKIAGNEAELIGKYLKGDEKSLEILVSIYLKPIYSFVFRQVGKKDESEDITQDIFIKVWKNIKRFDQSKSFKTWIFTIAKNTVIDSQRKKKTIPLSSFENADGKNMVIEKISDSSPLPSEIFYKKNLKQGLDFSIKKLNPEFQTILFLRYNDHFKFREIADILGEPLQTVKSRHRRAVIALKKNILSAPKNQPGSYY